MRNIEISETIQKIYKSGEFLSKTTAKINARTCQLEEALINLTRDIGLKEISASAGICTYCINTFEGSIYITPGPFSEHPKVLNKDPFNESLFHTPFIEYATRSEKIQFIRDIPEILSDICFRIEGLSAENEEVLNNSELDVFNVIGLENISLSS